nr:non-specific lipid-transfer protein-like [Tanacetum cinerariifolium]
MASMLMVVPFGEAITCGQVVSSLSPCFSYLTKGGAVPPACCGAVKGLAANSTPDRRIICGCLKGASNSGIKLDNANTVPSKCGVNIPYKISPDTDCSKIQ